MAALGAKSALSQAGLFQGRADTYSPEKYKFQAWCRHWPSGLCRIPCVSLESEGRWPLRSSSPGYAWALPQQ